MNKQKIEDWLDVTISHGTHRTQDLMESFITVLEELDHSGSHRETVEEGKRYIAMYSDQDPDSDTENFDNDASEFLNDIVFSAMNDLAPDGYYFGSHIGDGSDFGFWGIEGFDEEFL